MTIPKIVQLPSGMYRCQLRIDGQSISITDADRDTVEAKAYAYKAGILKARKSPEDITVGTALERYIDSRRTVCSPATVRGYDTIKNNRFLDLQRHRISALTKSVIQSAINDEAALCSPKTLKNAFALISSAIVEAGGEQYKVTLAQIPKKEKLYLNPKQVPVFCNAVKGDPVEVAALLALWSLRRSELLALEWSDVDLSARRISVNKAIVPNSQNEFIEKNTTKNYTSSRNIPIVDQLYSALLATPEDKRVGKVVLIPVGGIYKRINTICRKNNLPEIGVHGLRHSFASLAYHLNLPPKQAMAIGGWKNDRVMLEIYTHIAEEETAGAENIMTRFFNDAHGIAHADG